MSLRSEFFSLRSFPSLCTLLLFFTVCTGASFSWFKASVTTGSKEHAYFSRACLLGFPFARALHSAMVSRSWLATHHLGMLPEAVDSSFSLQSIRPNVLSVFSITFSSRDAPELNSLLFRRTTSCLEKQKNKIK